MAADTRKLVMGDWSPVVRDPLDILRLLFGACAAVLAAQIVYLCLARIEVMPDPRQEALPHHEIGIFVAVFALGLAVGALWEIFEYTSDGVFGSALSQGNTDTVGDLVAHASGSLAGGGLMVLWSRRGWGSVRRIPGENRAEDTRS